MIYLLFIPIAIQGMAMFFDEFYYHHKRGLPKWEKIGHPVDTASVLLCFGLAAFGTYSLEALATYIGLAAFSSLLITKDEFVHAENCDPAEAWLHSLLFVLHPIVFIAIAFTWYLSSIENSLWPQAFANSMQINSADLAFFLKSQLVIIFFFFIYQIYYWSFYDNRRQNK